MKPQPCRYCQKPIVFARTAQGKAMPISIESCEKRAVLIHRGPDKVDVEMRDTYLPHHVDCPKVDEARRDKELRDLKRKEAGLEDG